MVVYICANVWLCGAEPRKTTGTAFFYGELNLKTLRASPSVRATTLLRQAFSASICTSSLWRSVTAVNIYRCFAVWCRGKETNIMAARTDFIDELLQLNSLQTGKNKKACIKLFLRNFFDRKTSYRQDCKPS